MRSLASKNSGLEVEIEEGPESLQCGSIVTVLARRQKIARGCVTFLGESGRQLWWGTQTLGKGKALVQIDQILKPAYKPPMRYFDMDSDKTWPKNTTLGQLWDDYSGTLLLGVKISNLELAVLSGGGDEITTDTNVESVRPENKTEIHKSEDESIDTKQIVPQFTFTKELSCCPNHISTTYCSNLCCE
jgi:hypothetical protein